MSPAPLMIGDLMTDGEIGLICTDALTNTYPCRELGLPAGSQPVLINEEGYMDLHART